MFIGNSADDKKTCICMGDSRANVGGAAGRRKRQNEVVVGWRVTSLRMLLGVSADGQKTCISTRVSRANVGGKLWGGSDKIKLCYGEGPRACTC